MPAQKKTSVKKSVAKRGKTRQKRTETLSLPIWAWIVLVVVALGTAYLIFLRFGPAAQTPEAPPALTQQPLPDEVDVEVAYVMYTNGAIFLDVRPAGAYRMGSIPNSINIPLDELSDRLDEVPTVGDIVVVDETGMDAAQGRDILIAAGFRRVTAMKGGLEVWILERGFPFYGVFPR